MKQKKQSPLEQLFLNGKNSSYKKHQLIYSSDEKPTSVYYIQKGHVAVYSAQTPKNTRLLTILKPKDFFPLLEILINDSKPGRFIALDETRIAILPRKEFAQALKESQYTQDVLTYVANLLSTFIDKVNNLEISKSNARLIGKLIFFAQKYGTQKGGSIFINIPMTHAIIASSIATTRETVTRELIKLEKKRLIQYKNQRITINNLKELEKELSQLLS